MAGSDSRRWAMRMQWRDLLFAHWSVDSATLRSLIPAELEVDLFDGRAYIGVVPFRMERVKPRGVLAVPGLHSFPELNLRTYVRAGGKAGVWFFSLDAGQKIAVRVARRCFHLPYFDASFKLGKMGQAIEYSATRTHRGAPQAAFAAKYYPIGPIYQSAPGTLDSWLTDRYCLYSADARGIVYRGEIDHGPWPLQAAVADIQLNTLGNWLGIGMEYSPDTLHFSKSLDVTAWLVQPIAAV